MAKYLYDDFIVRLSEKFIRRLEEIESDFNFELGDEFEFALCDILQDLLPDKFGVARGFVVDQNGNKRGDDIIIYDRNRFPTLRFRDKDNVHRLENIPIEAVYAYIEAKHTIEYDFNNKNCNFFKAFEQAIEVKKLISTRKPRNIFSFNPYFTNTPFFEKARTNENLKLLPSINNPAFSCIVARNFKFSTKTIENKDIDSIEFLTENILIPCENIIPDLIVLNKDIIFYPALVESGNVTDTSTLFMNDGKDKVAYRILIRKNIAFGIFLSHLLFAIDWIKLDKMPWDLIHFDATRNKEN